ncbi:MAG: tetratricopeptide repeat protein [Candidatus Hydrogenedentes bacterium]|nr:tetratricopeptide repeat protein [Candidatus Hydrogenedentota bacterium]
MVDSDTLELGGKLLTGVAFIPYLAWGIYALRRRYRYHEDIPPRVEALTLIGLILFFAAETYLLHRFMSDSPGYFFFAVLGLIVSAAALYGSMMISLSSQVIIDMIMPSERSKTFEPRYAPAEALERQEDFQGALQEYLVIARMFPREPTVLLRIAESYVRLGRHDEAVAWFERASSYIDSAERCLQVANRLCELYNRQLDRPDEAVRVLETYLHRYPEAEYADSVRQRLKRYSAPA